MIQINNIALNNLKKEFMRRLLGTHRLARSLESLALRPSETGLQELSKKSEMPWILGLEEIVCWVTLCCGNYLTIF